jgi:hypothetical protein
MNTWSLANEDISYENLNFAIDLREVLPMVGENPATFSATKQGASQALRTVYGLEAEAVD